MNDKEIERKAKELCKKTLKRKLEIFFYHTLIHGINNDTTRKDVSTITYDDFINFNLDNNKENEYTYSWQLKSDKDAEDNIDKIDEIFNKHFGETFNTIIKEYFKNDFNNSNIKEDIKRLYDQSIKADGSPQCHYCGITKNNIDKIIETTKGDFNNPQRFYTKRFYNRGHSIEIDQKEPNKGYESGNMVLCCYWCNNAKSDEFTYKEFKNNIAPMIRKIWLERFKYINIPEPPPLSIL